MYVCVYLLYVYICTHTIDSLRLPGLVVALVKEVSYSDPDTIDIVSAVGTNIAGGLSRIATDIAVAEPGIIAVAGPGSSECSGTGVTLNGN
jgi:hypothetical protein